MTGTYTLWAYHERVKRWIPLIKGASRQRAVEEMVARQDVTRRRNEPVRFKVRLDGERPDDP